MDTATRSNLYRFRDPQALLHPYTDAVENEREGALVMARGDGVYVWDETGKEYIEGMAGLWCVSLGFGNERLAEAAHRQMRTLPFYHGFNRRSHEPQVELAERLKALAPVPMARTFFANSGSEAIDSAIKLIWFYNNAIGRPAKKKIVGRRRGYHGITAAAASVTGVPANHAGFDLPFPGFLHTDCPALLAGRARRGNRRRVRLALRRLAGAPDPRRGAGDRRRLLRRAGDGARAA